MRLLLFTILTVSHLFGFGTAINWMTTLEDAKEAAKHEKKPIMLFIHSTACFYCTVLEEKVFPDKGLQEYLKKNFILLALDGSTDADAFEGQDGQAPPRYITSVTPAFFFIGPDEEKLGARGTKPMVIYGYWTIEELKEWSDDALKKFKKNYGEKYAK
ncbi:MAG: thioredoxin family protein [Sulfurimonas sp.]|nr:thioredoxin family protein [Sulfurimonas sp.]